MQIRPATALLAALFAGSCATPNAAQQPAPAAAPAAPAATAPVAPAPAAPPAPQPVTIKRVELCSLRPCGSSVTTIAPDGSLHLVFDMHDNGRGPGSDMTVRLSPAGFITELKSQGHTLMGTHIEETFAMANGRAHWESPAEHGDKDFATPAFFVPISNADLDGFLLAALVKNGGSLPLLPGGTARLEKAGEATIHLPAGDKHLLLQAVTGLDLSPTYMWTNDAGEFFGEVVSGFALLPEGAESAAEQLLPIQQQIDRARDLALYTRLAKKPPAAGFALTHARVLDVEKGKWLPDQTVLIQGETIAAVGPAKKVAVPKGAEVIDLAGKALLPGLWDMHAHFGPNDGVLNIASGVTSARDCGNIADTLDAFQKHFDEGSAVGPHLYRAGFIEGRGPDAVHTEITATDEAEAKAGVEFFARRGYEMIKIYNSIPPELVPVIAREAHAHGMNVTGHIPAHMLAHEAVEAGYDGIEHINQVLLNFFADHETDTRTLRRFTLVGEKAADFDPAGKPMHDFIQLLLAQHTVIDPTVDAFESMFVAETGKVMPDIAEMVARLPVQLQRGYLAPTLQRDGRDELYARSWKKMLQAVKVMQDAGVTIVAGTDDLAGLTLHHELELFVQAGLTPAEALRDATIVPARVMKADKKTGSIAKGKVADLVIIDGDPLANISDVHKTVATFRAGTELATAPLYESVGVR